MDTATKAVVAAVPVGAGPTGVAVPPDGARVYVTNALDNTVSVINAATNTVIGAPIPLPHSPAGIAMTPMALSSTWRMATTSQSLPRPPTQWWGIPLL